MEMQDFFFQLRTTDALNLIAERVAEIILSPSRNALTPTPIVPDKILSKKEVCQLLGVSLQTITNWMRDGKIKFHRKGRRVYFITSEVFLKDKSK